MIKKPSLTISMIPVIFLVCLLTINVIVFSDDSSYGPNQLALLFSAVLSALIGAFHLKHEYAEIEKKASNQLEFHFKQL